MSIFIVNRFVVYRSVSFLSKFERLENTIKEDGFVSLTHHRVNEKAGIYFCCDNWQIRYNI